MISGIKVLLMDDDEDLAYLTRRMARKLGFELLAVTDADAAVQAFSEARGTGAPFTALILDATIPGGRGAVQVLGEIREAEPSVGAVMTSGWSRDGVIADAQAHGFDAALPKPFDIEQLEVAVAAAAARTASRDGNAGHAPRLEPGRGVMRG